MIVVKSFKLQLPKGTDGTMRLDLALECHCGTSQEAHPVRYDAWASSMRDAMAALCELEESVVGRPIGCGHCGSVSQVLNIDRAELFSQMLAEVQVHFAKKTKAS